MHTGRTGPLLGSGRTADVYALDGPWVLRRYRHGVDTTGELAVLSYLSASGHPVPRIGPPAEEALPTDLVMQRLTGPTPAEALLAGTATESEGADLLARLLREPHAIPARLSQDPEDRILHLDLHPENVILAPRGPRVRGRRRRPRRRRTPGGNGPSGRRRTVGEGCPAHGTRRGGRPPFGRRTSARCQRGVGSCRSAHAGARYRPGGGMVWTQCIESRPFAEQRLVCFPHAGGSPYFFRMWGKALEEFEPHAVCYPGRAERITESPATDLKAMARQIATSLHPLLESRPTAFFGHSMGAIVAYETARALEAEGFGLTHLFASGARAPHLMQGNATEAARWDDEAIARNLVELGGTDAELLHNPAFLELVMPYIGADFRMLSSYSAGAPAPLGCAVTTLVGASDPRVTADQADAWRESTRGPFRRVSLPGDHFYLAADPPYAVIREAAAR